MYPKCKMCGSRTWRLIREVKEGKKPLFYYQDSNKCFVILEQPIQDTKNPLETV